MSARSTRSIGLLTAAALLLVPSRAAATPVDTNFTETQFAVVDGGEVTGIAWAPDGSNRLFVTRKGGEVRIVKDGALLTTPFATETVFTNSECGLIGLAFDPGFVTNKYVYFFATVSGTEQQIIRYTAMGDTGVNRTVIVPGLPTIGQNHDGGAVGFGPDGMLYWAIGDLGNFTGVDADLTSLASKIGRARPNGDVPADNPFVDGAGPNNDYIWARGFRNPFTFTWRPETEDLWVNTVGTSFEQVFVVGSGDHAGWNDFESNQPPGFIRPVISYRTNSSLDNTIAPMGASRSAGVATFTTTDSDHRNPVGTKVTIAGVGDASFNGTGFVTAVPMPNVFEIAQEGPDAASGGGSATSLNIGGAITGGTFFEST
ncbi:MAG TPA: PQQ-dependent sugar dehydrogenase, partial [Thermoanaerobaculia bacterium]|nr:PQQ-dependent sugar dehydrogenase [Thermoanaerobaculia bacterium]